MQGLFAQVILCFFSIVFPADVTPYTPTVTLLNAIEIPLPWDEPDDSVRDFSFPEALIIFIYSLLPFLVIV